MTDVERDIYGYNLDMRCESSTVPFQLAVGGHESEALRNVEKKIFVLDRHNNHFEIFIWDTHLRKQRILAEICRQASAAASIFLLISEIAKLVNVRAPHVVFGFFNLQMSNAELISFWDVF